MGILGGNLMSDYEREIMEMWVKRLISEGYDEESARKSAYRIVTTSHHD